ncbi:MAG: proteasome subunit alpha [Nitrospiraceae bacterium]
MYEEPYRWIEAVGNRRQYLDEQFKQGSPVVALSYTDGILLLTVSRGTPKLYEIYDRIGLGGIGHPADLEKLRFSLLEMAHLEGFNRSPSDVTGARMMKIGLAPLIKQAFEEIFKAPFIAKILLAELSVKPGKDTFLTIDYDGTFEETSGCAVLAATKAIQARMIGYLKHAQPLPVPSLDAALSLAAKSWAVGSLAQAVETEAEDKAAKEADKPATAHEPDDPALVAHLRETLADKQMEAAVLERHAPGSSKYRVLKGNELTSLIPKSAQASA